MPGSIYFKNVLLFTITMRVLGIDPGSMVTGYGVVDDIKGKLTHVTHGTIEGKRKDSFPDRLKLIFDGLNKVIEEHEYDYLALEYICEINSVK